MAARCLASLHLCRIRVTRLDALGNPTAGPNNVYVSDKPIQLQVTPEIEAGSDTTLVGGCDCIVATRRGFDKLKRFTLQLDLGDVEPGLLEMLIGADAILDGADPIGIWWPVQQFDCAVPAQPSVAFEGWTDLWEDDRQAADWPYAHWIWPSTSWQIGPHTLQNDFLQPQLNGYSRGNSQWGVGPFHDAPEAVGQLGGFFYDTEIPDASCGYQSHTIT